MVTHSLTYGYARVSKADDEARNLETQLRLLDDHGVTTMASGFDRPHEGTAAVAPVEGPGEKHVLGPNHYERLLGGEIPLSPGIPAHQGDQAHVFRHAQAVEPSLDPVRRLLHQGAHGQAVNQPSGSGTNFPAGVLEVPVQPSQDCRLGFSGPSASAHW